MKQLFIIANWKENMLEEQAREWYQQMVTGEWQTGNKTVIVCPPFTLLSEIKQLVTAKRIPLQVGAQNISEFPQSAHTGEEAGDMLKEYAEYVIIGHSERRAMGETDEIVNKKIAKAQEYNLLPIVCVSNEEQTHSLVLPSQPIQSLIAYEPLHAIGTGKAEDPQEANSVAKNIKTRLGNVAVLYGGSVNEKNVHLFTQQEYIDGVLVGGASLIAGTFIEIIKNA